MYKEHHKAFSQNVEYAARTWHYYVGFRNLSAENKDFLDAINKSARFWLDYYYAAPQTVIIFLGKIFGNDNKDRKVYNIAKTMTAAFLEKAYFSKAELRKRKIALSGGEFDGIDDYISKAHELSEPSLKSISHELRKAKAIWVKIKPLRDKVYAHHEMLTDEEKNKLYAEVKNSDIEDILQILLNISNALHEAEINGKEPDFTTNYTVPLRHAQKEIEALSEVILGKNQA